MESNIEKFKGELKKLIDDYDIDSMKTSDNIQEQIAFNSKERLDLYLSLLQIISNELHYELVAKFSQIGNEPTDNQIIARDTRYKK